MPGHAAEHEHTKQPKRKKASEPSNNNNVHRGGPKPDNLSKPDGAAQQLNFFGLYSKSQTTFVNSHPTISINTDSDSRMSALTLPTSSHFQANQYVTESGKSFAKI